MMMKRTFSISVLIVAVILCGAWNSWADEDATAGSDTCWTDFKANAPDVSDADTCWSEFESGKPAYASEVNYNFGTLKKAVDKNTASTVVNALGMVPVGSIIAWDKSSLPTGNQTLPDNWKQCDGQTLADDTNTNGSYAGKTLPDLNGFLGGDKMFLRGGTESGEETGETGDINSVEPNTESTSDNIMNVVWIIRIK